MKMVVLNADRAAMEHGHIGLAIPIAAWPIFKNKSNLREIRKGKFILPARVFSKMNVHENTRCL